MQKKHLKSWMFLKWARRVRAKWLRRARNVLIDSSHYIAKRIVEIAREYSAVVALEDLENLRRGLMAVSSLGKSSYGVIGDCRTS